jgi:hypothetical protein
MNDQDERPDPADCAGDYPENDPDPDRCILCGQPRSEHPADAEDAAE